MCKIIYQYSNVDIQLFSYIYQVLYSPNSTKHPIPYFKHPNRNWNRVLPFDSNHKFHLQPNSRILIGLHFLSILEMELLICFNSKQTFQHLNTALGIIMNHHTLLSNYPSANVDASGSLKDEDKN